MSSSLAGGNRSLDRRVDALGLLAAGGLVLAGLWGMERWLRSQALLAADEGLALSVARSEIELDISERQSLRDLAARDLARTRANAAGLSRSRRELFEGGLALSTERRLLDKQWEIMSLWIRVEQAAEKIHVLRGDQVAESLPLSGARPRAVGGPTRLLPRAALVASKERFAHPERPRVEQSGGQLLWEPPQVGDSPRAGALGEFVLFTREGLVVHGPPLKVAEHEAYPHLCLSLPRPVARRLYARSFVGTKIVLEGPPRP